MSVNSEKWKLHRLFSKRGRISFRHTGNDATAYETHFHFVFVGISDLILSQFSLCGALRKIVSVEFGLVLGFLFILKKEKQSTKFFWHFFPFRISSQVGLVCFIGYVCVCMETYREQLKEPLSFIQPIGFVKFKFIRNSSFPRGSHSQEICES